MHIKKVGEEHSNFITGKYSRYIQVLSAEEADRFRQIQSVEDYLSLTPDIHAVQTEIEEVHARARLHGETSKAWRQAQDAFNRFIDAQEAKNKEASMAALMELRQSLDAGNAVQNAREEVTKLRATLQRLVESQRRRAIEHGELVQLAIVLNILRLSAGSFRQHLKNAGIDPTIAERILESVDGDLDRVTGGAIQTLPPAKRLNS